MTQQEFVEQNVRTMIGDLTVQIIMLRGRIAELEEQLKQLSDEKPVPKRPLKNGEESHA